MAKCYQSLSLGGGIIAVFTLSCVYVIYTKQVLHFNKTHLFTHSVFTWLEVQKPFIIAQVF